VRLHPHTVFASLAVTLLFGGALAQNPPTPPRVVARLSADSLWIGDQFTLEVEVDKDLTQLVDFPSYLGEGGVPGTLGQSVEVLSESPVDTLARDGRAVTIRKRYLLTVFEAGRYNLGLFPALYADKNIVDTLRSTDSLRFIVQTFPIDTLSMDIRDIRPPLAAPVKAGEWLGWAVLAFFAAQLLFALVYIIRHRAAKATGSRRRANRPDDPPHVAAIRELERLHGEKLWQNQRHKLYYTRLTDIVRQYIESRYDIGAMEMTSDEITAALHGLGIPERSHDQIRRLLSTADYVKFAKYVPGPDDNEQVWNDAYYFIEETKRQPASADGEEDTP